MNGTIQELAKTLEKAQHAIPIVNALGQDANRFRTMLWTAQEIPGVQFCLRGEFISATVRRGLWRKTAQIKSSVAMHNPHVASQKLIEALQ